MRGKRNIGIGYIIVPTSSSFSDYIQTCYKSKTVSIVTEDSEIYHQVKLGGSLLSQIKFPDQQRKEIIGSIVIYIRKRESSIPTIVSVLELNDSGVDLLPGQWRVTSNTETSNTSLIQGDVKDGTLDIVTSSQTKSSVINIRATSQSKDSTVNIESDSMVSVLAENIFKVVSGEKIQLGEDDKTEPTLLGTSWKDFQEKFIDLLKRVTITMPTATAGSNPVIFVGPGTISLDSQQSLESSKSGLDSLLTDLVEVQ